jgi:hypothetical protein
MKKNDEEIRIAGSPVIPQREVVDTAGHSRDEPSFEHRPPGTGYARNGNDELNRAQRHVPEDGSVHLIPCAVAWLIHMKGDAVNRISVKRAYWHHYNMSVRTKTIQRELRQLEVAELTGARLAETNPAPGKNRRCAA